MEEVVIPLAPVERLIEFYTKELYTEIVFNNDSSSFWKKAQDYVFNNSLTSFREGLRNLIDGMNEDKEMYNYFSALCFRIFTQPFTEPALNVFQEGFDDIITDNIFKSGFDWVARGLSKVELLILFLTVHRNEILLMMDKKIPLNKATAQAADKRQYKGKR